MNKRLSKLIYKEIKKYDSIVLARHVGADPDALAAQLSLKESIKETFPKKNVYAIGSSAARFKFFGALDKVEEYPKETLLIVLDTPDIKRIDNVDITKFTHVIKIDHHPFVESFGGLEVIDESSSSSAQMVLELIFNTKLVLNTSIAEKLYLGIAADTNRFLHEYTTKRTFDLINKLVHKTNINFTSLYEPLYLRPLSEVKFQGYLAQNMVITENGFAYIKIPEALIKEFGIDSSSPGNMINDFAFINEVMVWAFFTEDTKNNLIRVNIRSRGPVINEIASKYNGGGHPYASGAKLSSWEHADDLIVDLDKVVREYKEASDNNGG